MSEGETRRIPEEIARILEWLKEKHVQALLYLEREEVACLADFRRELKADYYRARAIVLKLLEEGLIREKRWKNVRFYFLTKKGKKVLAFLRALSKL